MFSAHSSQKVAARRTKRHQENDAISNTANECIWILKSAS